MTKTEEWIKTRCSRCGNYYEYENKNITFECPFCHTNKYLTALTQEDISFLKEKGLY